MGSYTKRSWATIDMDAVRHNYQLIRSITDKTAKIMAVIKADGYGHGAVMLAEEYASLGADWFAVSNIDEAIELREAGLTLPILILGYTSALDAPRLYKYDITQAIYSGEYAEALGKQAHDGGFKLKIHIKLDTGMSRIGFYYHDTENDAKSVEDVVRVCSNDAFITDGIFTHFAVADDGKDGEEFTRKQYGLFTDFIDRCGQHGIHFNNRHCCNSAAIIDYPEMHLDMVRPGIILYGLAPSPILRGKIDLHPVMKLNTVVSRVKDIDAGVDISYGRTYTTSSPTRVATVPIGYADGYPRHLSSKGVMLINGKRAKILGRVCMDQLMLDVTGIDGVKEGTPVLCFGGRGEDGISVDELADMIDTINYEMTCMVSKRIPRVYTRDGKEISVRELCGNSRP